MTGYESDEAGAWNVPRPSGEETVANEVIDQILERNARWNRHTADLDRKTTHEPEPNNRGVIWAWVAMGALVALYCVWRFWK